MDYESEEGSDGEEGDGEQAEEGAPEEGAPEEASEENPNPENTDPLPMESSDNLAETESQDKMRVNAVLGIGSSIESYRYDSVNGLWCEVSTVKYGILAQVSSDAIHKYALLISTMYFKVILCHYRV